MEHCAAFEEDTGAELVLGLVEQYSTGDDVPHELDGALKHCVVLAEDAGVDLELGKAKQNPIDEDVTLGVEVVTLGVKVVTLGVKVATLEKEELPALLLVLGEKASAEGYTLLEPGDALENCTALEEDTNAELAFVPDDKAFSVGE